MPIDDSAVVPGATSADAPKSLATMGDEGPASTATGEAIAASGSKLPNVGRFRWVICALLFFATTINYVDRQVLGIIAPGLQNGPVLFTPAMIADPPALAAKLSNPSTPAARFLAARLSPSTRVGLAGGNGTTLRAALTTDFNRIVSGPLLNSATFNTQGFSEHLQQQVEKFGKAPPKGEDVTRFNHWLIEESFPGSIETSMRWSDKQYGYINSAFSAAYAIGMLLVGGLLDRFGVRAGYALALFVWSVAAMGHAFASSAFSFGVARFALGLGEAANFPAAIKTVAEWFPRRERALCTGIFNSGSNIGAILAPLCVPALALAFGWQSAFVATGLIGMLWLFFWLPIYRAPEEHPKVSPSELAYIRSDPADPPEKMRWAELLKHRQTWAILAGRSLTEIPWWFYLFWGAKFLDTQFGVSLKQVGLPLIVIYVVADFGSIGGGWLSSSLLKRGWSVNAARKTALLVCALCVLPVTLAPHSTNLWVAVGLIALAAAAHQGWSANYFTLASDMFPRRAVGSVVGISGFVGALSNVGGQAIIGNVLDKNGGNYTPLFLLCGVAYLTALGIVHLIIPKMTPIGMGDTKSA
ncbi:Sugar phosphate permease [Abditibacterium utsteinense]|uniref:Sugar phosphate permease n=1 Tax=Abditibacterium utsteinense TaxID=1960156 RepID=A0A2S8SNS8_9BACT|nr:MFS transporter [Abditibacterium utsteinense]PQV62447.1 Sugar phosphate permease [Abditibacterium utsteinense]